jgi:hypothetical protein
MTELRAIWRIPSKEQILEAIFAILGVKLSNPMYIDSFIKNCMDLACFLKRATLHTLLHNIIFWFIGHTTALQAASLTIRNGPTQPLSALYSIYR